MEKEFTKGHELTVIPDITMKNLTQPDQSVHVDWFTMPQFCHVMVVQLGAPDQILLFQLVVLHQFP